MAVMSEIMVLPNGNALKYEVITAIMSYGPGGGCGLDIFTSCGNTISIVAESPDESIDLRDELLAAWQAWRAS